MRRLLEMWRNRRDDRGFTLTELLVSVSVMGVVMAITTGAVLLASSTSARVDATGSAQQQVHTAFDRLDREVRWASAFSQPGAVGQATYVEWLYTAGGAPVCHQLRLDSTTQVLAERSWPQGSVTKASAWSPLASRVTTAPGATKGLPFTTTAAGTAGFSQSRLSIQVTSTAGGKKLTDTVTHDVTYTAVNSGGSSTSSTTVCSEGRPTA